MGKLINCYAAATALDFPGYGYGGCLINLIDNCATESMIKNTNQWVNKANPRLLIQDNSGYVLHTREKAGKKIILDDSKPLKYKGVPNPMPKYNVHAALEVNPDILIASDWPVKKFKNETDQEREFVKKLSFNTKWAIETYELLKKNPTDTCLYVAFQGYSLRHLDIFFKSIGFISFNGVSMPIRGQSIGKTALFLVKFWQMGFKNLHLLGTSALFPMALAAYFARHFFVLVTLDASSWKIKAKFNEYANPHNLKSIQTGEDVEIDPAIKMDCQCPACKGRSFQYYRNLPYYFRRVLFSTHNFWATEKMGQELFKHAGTINSLINFLRAKTDRVREIEELYDVLCLVEAFKKEDIRYLEDLLA